MGIIAISPSLPQFELHEAEKFAEKYEIKLKYIHTDELKNTNYISNPENRCYYCKSELYTKIRQYGEKHGIKTIIDGTNASELSGHRPGYQACIEMEVETPYVTFNFTKDDIREVSRYFGLPTWDKGSFACLSSRIPAGDAITEEKLSRIENCENFLFKNNFKIFRVRFHNNIARLELDGDGICRLLKDKSLRNNITEFFKTQGFVFVTLDLEEFRSGRLSEI
jgi:uncharacterized protein